MRDLPTVGIAKFLAFAVAMSVRSAVLDGVEPVQVTAHVENPRCAPHPVKFPCFVKDAKRS